MILTIAILINLLSIAYAAVKDRYDIADVLWGINITLACGYFAFKQGFTGLEWLSIGLVFIWGSRLSFHIGSRFLKKKTQDIRYENLVKNHKFLITKISKVFLLQILLAILMSATFWNINSISSISWNIIIGLTLFIIGFGFEVVSDLQLKKFVSNPNNKGQILTTGLYSLSRHPNYFGEVLLWWGIWIINGFNLTGLITPLLISFLILKVSGIPMSEKYLSTKKGFDKYASKTNVFFPWKRK